MSGGAVERDQLVGRVTGALKVSESEAQTLITELAGGQLLQTGDDARAPVELTDTGQ